MGIITDRILHPQKVGLTGHKKPVALIVHNSAEQGDSAMNFHGAVKYLNDLGYGTANKTDIMFDKANSSSLGKAIKKGRHLESLTLWCEAHGLVGWFFGHECDEQSEFYATVDFADFVHLVEATTGSYIEQIVLNGCYTGAEFLNPESPSYFNSPARLLSVLLPDRNVVGFIGKNSSAKIKNIYRKVPPHTYEPVIVNPDQAAIVFRNGRAIESFTEHFYGNGASVPEFILEAVDLELDEEQNASAFYAFCSAREILEKKGPIKSSVYGEAQRNKAMHEVNDYDLVHGAQGDEMPTTPVFP